VSFGFDKSFKGYRVGPEMAITDAEYENQRFIILRRFRDMPDAFLFSSILDSAEIECFLADENTIRMDWFWSNLLGRIKLCVRKADADEASSLLDQGVPEKFDVEGVGEYEQPRCPTCQSPEISSRGLNNAVDYVGALLGGPRPLHRSLWECDGCGQQWPESAEKPPNNLLTSASSILLLVTALSWLIWIIVTLHDALSR
jgi:ribosomal protein L37AE/L43A